MTQRRIFSKKITESDAFIDLPASSQALYFHLNMNADDDGFVSSPKRIMRMLGAADDEFKLLLAKRFLIAFDSGVCVVKHWWMHNTLQKDRYLETVYLDEKNTLVVKENKSYSECYQNDNKKITELNLTKLNLTKNKRGFTPPSLEDVSKYCKERKNSVDPEVFINFYESKGWMVGKNKMKSWKAAVRTWEKNRKDLGFGVQLTSTKKADDFRNKELEEKYPWMKGK